MILNEDALRRSDDDDMWKNKLITVDKHQLNYESRTRENIINRLER